MDTGRAFRALRWAVLVEFAAWGVLPFVAAGSARWAAGWTYFAVLGVGLVAHQAVVSRLNRALMKRRENIGAGTKPWDLVWNLVFWPLMALGPVVAGLEARRGGGPGPVWDVVLGALVLAGGFAVSAWAMATNRFFESTVRIQKDQGHVVVDTGPYRFVRHPGYVGLCLWALATPLLLRSSWAWAPAAAVVAWVAVRTALEDGMLRRELGGYAEYARRVRYRLLPGVW